MLVQIRSNFAFLLVDHLILFDNIVLIFSSPQTMPRAEIRPAFLFNRELHPVSPKVILIILFEFCQPPFNSLCLLSDFTK